MNGPSPGSSGMRVVLTIVNIFARNPVNDTVRVWPPTHYCPARRTDGNRPALSGEFPAPGRRRMVAKPHRAPRGPIQYPRLLCFLTAFPARRRQGRGGAQLESHPAATSRCRRFRQRRRRTGWPAPGNPFMARNLLIILAKWDVSRVSNAIPAPPCQMSRRVERPAPRHPRQRRCCPGNSEGEARWTQKRDIARPGPQGFFMRKSRLDRAFPIAICSSRRAPGRQS